MTQDVSGFGSILTIIASNTFPVGLPITQFSDDTDALDLPSIVIGDAVMGVNGDLIVWSKANPLPATISVIPGSPDDLGLQIIANANRPGKGKSNAGDIITLNAIYPDGSTVTLTNGKMLNAQFGKSITSAGRIKTRVYSFAFENKIGA